jgi:hypothetical protein
MNSLHPNGYVVPDLSGRNLKWKLVVDGADLIVENAVATWFGGDFDPQDDGTTASGNNTKGHPNLIACSLPMRVDSVANLRKSPLPHMPFGMFGGYRDNPHGAQVNVVNKQTGKSLQHVACIDIGPALYTQHALDLTVAAFEALGVPHKSGIQTVDLRILDAARYLA